MTKYSYHKNFNIEIDYFDNQMIVTLYHGDFLVSCYQTSAKAIDLASRDAGRMIKSIRRNLPKYLKGNRQPIIFNP